MSFQLERRVHYEERTQCAESPRQGREGLHPRRTARGRHHHRHLLRRGSPIYLNQRKAAWNSTIQSDVKNASLVVETAMTANNGKFDNGWAGTYSPGKAKLGTSDQEITVSKDVKIVIAKGADSNNYTITGTDSNSGTKQYTYDSANGAISESAKAAAPAKP